MSEHVAWMRYKHCGETTIIMACDQDAPGAFKVYREAAFTAADVAAAQRMTCGHVKADSGRPHSHGRRKHESTE